MSATYLDLGIHVVFSTKGRAPMIENRWRGDLHGYLGGCVRNYDAIPLEIGGVEDHVHLLIALRATHCVSDLVRDIKKGSSVWAKDQYHAFAWQTGYGAFSVAHRDREAVRKYIQTQEEHHRGLSSEDELRRLLAEHGIPYDERYFE